MPTTLNRLVRRKYINWNALSNTKLARCLTTLDLVALGVGSTLGAGAYVITGQVAKDDAGPAVIVSFLIAAVASVLAGVCYAEFGARVPKTGSAYTFTYVTVGEGLAFVIGWNLLLEYVIGSASVARTFSGYFDYLAQNNIRPWFNVTFPMNVDTLAPYADPMAMIVVLLITLVLAIGVKESANVNKVFTGLNLIVLTYIVIAGAFKDDPKNWNLPKSQVDQHRTCGSKKDESCGDGGFAPFGVDGVIKGAATAFYAYVGFDAIATTGEEVKHPQKSIPISIVVSLFIVFIFYSALAITVTMMAPYYELSSDAPIAEIFDKVGWNVAKYIITVGAICALSTSLLGAMFPMPRVVMAMSRDGLIFRFLGHVHPKFKTPIYATVFSGCLAGFMAFLFDVDALVNMMSIGTLLAYTLVTCCVLLLRFDYHDEDRKFLIDAAYKKFNVGDDHERLKSFISNDHTNTRTIGEWYPPINISTAIKEIFRPSARAATPFSASLVKALAALTAVDLIAICCFITFGRSLVFTSECEWWAVLIFAICCLTLLICFVVISLQRESVKKISFRVPLVPFIPMLSMFINIYLMLQLDYLTWVRFAVWLAIGFTIYFCYGMCHSSEELGIGERTESEMFVVDGKTDHLPPDPEPMGIHLEPIPEDELVTMKV